MFPAQKYVGKSSSVAVYMVFLFIHFFADLGQVFAKDFFPHEPSNNKFKLQKIGKK